MPVKYKDFTTFMKEMGTLNAYTPGATTTSSNSTSGSSSKKEIAPISGGKTTKGVGEGSYFSTFSGALSDKVSLENKKVDNAYSVAQGQLGLERDRLSSGNVLEQAKLALSKTQSAAQIEATNKANDRAFTLANRELAQRNREAAANAANNRAQVDIQDYKARTERKSIRSNERLGLAKVGAEKYATKTGFEAAQMTDSTNRLKIRNDLELGKLTLASNELINQRNTATQRNATLGSVIAGWG